MPKVFTTNTLPLIITLLAVFFLFEQFIVVLAGSSEVEVGKLTSRVDSIDRRVDANAQRLDAAVLKLTDKGSSNSERIAENTVQILEIQNQLNSLSGRVWALVVGVLAQLLNVVWGFLKTRTVRQ